MKYLIPVLFLGLLAGCSTVSIRTSGCRLQSITYTETFDQDTREWEETFFYDGDGNLSRMDNSNHAGSSYFFAYENERIASYEAFSNPSSDFVSKEEITYDRSNNIKKIVSFNKNEDGEYEARWETEFEYYVNGEVKERKVFFHGTQEYSYFEKYQWKNGNVAKMEFFSSGRELMYEFFYTYDNKVNYKRGIPTYLKNPVDWSQNNVKVMEYKDHYGNLDLICGPCENSYKYNSDDLPTKIERSWGRTLVLEYEKIDEEEVK